MKITQPDSRGAMFLTLTLVCCDGMVEVKMQSTTALRRSGPEEGALKRANAPSLNLDLSSLFLHSRSFILESQNKNKTTAPTGSSDFHFTQARSAERISVTCTGHKGLVELGDLHADHGLQRFLQSMVVTLQLPVIFFLVSSDQSLVLT